MTCPIGVACYLAGNKSQWKGTVMLIGQPAEKRGTADRAMLDDSLFERFHKPDFAIALHSPLFYPDVNAILVTGVSTMSSAVLELLEP